MPKDVTAQLGPVTYHTITLWSKASRTVIHPCINWTHDCLTSVINHMMFIPCYVSPHNTNRLLLKSLQKDIFQINSSVHHLSKELKSLFHNRNFFVIMFQPGSHSTTLHNEINSVKMDILPILAQASIAGLQKLNQYYLTL